MCVCVGGVGTYVPPPTRYTVTTRMTLSPFNVSLIVWAMSRGSVHKPQFLWRERTAGADRTEVLLPTSVAPYREAKPAKVGPTHQEIADRSRFNSSLKINLVPGRYVQAGSMGHLGSWCFKSSQPQRIISGLKEIFIRRYIVERTNKAEIRPEEQSERAESCWENLLKNLVERAIKTETDRRKE